MTLFIIANPNAGPHKAHQVVEKIQKDYPQLDQEIVYTTGPDDEKYQVDHVLSSWADGDRLLILGGDGTLSKVLYYLPEDIPFAYYPVGSGNDFAKALQLPDLDGTMATLLTGCTREITIFVDQAGILLNSLDLGFSAWVVKQAAQSKIKSGLNRFHLGKMTYVLIAILSLFKKPMASVQLKKGSGELLEVKDIYFFSLANNTYFGGGIMIWPSATVFDSNLHLVYAKGENFWQRLVILLTLVLKKHETSSYLNHALLDGLTLTFPDKTLLAVDGEILQCQQMTLTAQKRKIYL
ncbi:diacylglycerol kinase family protein [Streptococcus criceti]|uniref:Diacylglycerol kinase domain protein n=1 Tax=Streptococcus criceti HS-6 TaxID=873449 RepID=G5JPP6_STRCG|nr:diacylglycerol kinase family protein [Streptococcus criceti]EHI74641.1 diacylglycerol kinase domain protein [Streptococcus criceti HS-6]SUN41888.1 diacylglycerol kinase family protein [Streptococcus criceti]